ncbi:hemoglobin [Actinomycetospora succinea]|uniref:Hemoglobin n=1 Tax=Actinomycetospora succinea TaxID=663603 RepID=A0A4R6V8M2_9PSEU|nr:group II truncated hemoglobin [Actinomycetospora succinea]TDQ55662.1 hemoglobin [Actinomycetospora succinea]
MGAAPSSGRPSVFDAVGGEQAFLALARAHHRRCLADPELEHPFSKLDQHPQHVERLAAYWAEVMGGPPRYSRSGADQSHVLWLHSGNGEIDDLGRRFLACFLAALDDAGVPADPELRACLRAYMEWAVADVLAYSPTDAVVPDAAPMPRWGWEGLVR